MEKEEIVRAARKAVLEGCRQISGRGYVLGAAGNISARVGTGGCFVITPTGSDLGEVTLEQLVVLDGDGNVLEGTRPSSEWMIHREIYVMRPEINAVVHTHSPCATAVSSIDGMKTVPVIDIEMILHIGGEITVAPFAVPGTQQLAEEAAKGLEEKMCVLLQHHGNVCVGKNIYQAVKCCDNIERSCDMLLKIYASGRKISEIPSEYLAKAKGVFAARQKAR